MIPDPLAHVLIGAAIASLLFALRHYLHNGAPAVHGVEKAEARALEAKAIAAGKRAQYEAYTAVMAEAGRERRTNADELKVKVINGSPQ